MSSIRFIRSRSDWWCYAPAGRIMMSSSRRPHALIAPSGCSNDISSSDLSCCCCTVRIMPHVFLLVMSACPHIFRFRMRKLSSPQVAPAWFRILAFTRECTSLNSPYPGRRGGLSCAHGETVLVAAAQHVLLSTARTVKPSHIVAMRLAVGIPILSRLQSKACPATLMLFSVGTVPTGGTPTL